MATSLTPKAAGISSMSQAYVQPGVNFFASDRHLVGSSGGFHESIYPNPMNPNAPTLEFKIGGDQSTMVDMRSIHLRIKAKMTDNTFEDLGVDQDGAPANNLLHSLFTNYELALQGKVVETGNNMYAQKAYIENEVSQNPQSKITWLKCHGYEYEAEPENRNHQVHRDRMTSVKDGNEMNLYGELAVDFFSTENFLLPGVEARLKLTRSADKFVTISDDDLKDYHIEILEARLEVHKIVPSPDAWASVLRGWQSKPARYAYTEVIPKNFIINLGHDTLTLDDVFDGKSISRITMGFLTNDSFSGRNVSNPHSYHNPGVERIEIIREGQAVGCTPLHFQDDGVMAYYNTLRALGIRRSGGNGIRLQHFQNHFILSFALTSDLRVKEDLDRPELTGGRIRIVIKFHAHAIVAHTRFIVLGERRAAVYIDKDKNVYQD